MTPKKTIYVEDNDYDNDVNDGKEDDDNFKDNKVGNTKEDDHRCP